MALKYLFSVFKFECAWCSNSSLSKYIHMCVCTSEYVYTCMLYNSPQKVLCSMEITGDPICYISSEAWVCITSTLTYNHFRDVGPCPSCLSWPTMHVCGWENHTGTRRTCQHHKEDLNPDISVMQRCLTTVRPCFPVFRFVCSYF